ncbi:MAG: PIG-L family deacetylase [Candidatus Electrothrix sp. ATG2]|nr:PIG-L family deacetylase [Candidatus Electrothrix sp. ATG2]
MPRQVGTLLWKNMNLCIVKHSCKQMTSMLLNNLDEAYNYDHIYLAPHPDDAALSCGGAIACRHLKGERQLVVTLCSAIPSTAELYWRQRLEEDKRALGVLGADRLLGGFLDAPFRHPTYEQENCLFASPETNDSMQKDVEQLLAAIAEQNRQAKFYVPLGVGSHVDHLITYDAAQTITHVTAIHFYEDFPYTAKNPNALEVRLAALNDNFTVVDTDVRHCFLKKAEAVAQYTSQVHFLFGNFDTALQALIQEGQRVLPGALGERCWILM